MIIDAARVDEAGALTQLALASKRHWGYDDAFIERCRIELTVHESDVEAHRVFVARDAERICGFYSIKSLDATCAELDMLFVEPRFIGGGIGGALMHHAMSAALDSGVSSLRIVADPCAAPFYEHFGARLAGSSTSPSTGRSLPAYELSLRMDGEAAPVT